jgi:hypothetical protein
MVAHKEPTASNRLQNFRFLSGYFLNELCSLGKIPRSESETCNSDARLCSIPLISLIKKDEDFNRRHT